MAFFSLGFSAFSKLPCFFLFCSFHPAKTLLAVFINSLLIGFRLIFLRKFNSWSRCTHLSSFRQSVYLNIILVIIVYRQPEHFSIGHINCIPFFLGFSNDIL